jgi:group I intron endonuclease
MIAYRITNTVNGMQYVGVTTMTLRKRWSCHIAESRGGGQRVLCKAIRKYGRESFCVEHVANALSMTDLGPLEAVLVDQAKCRVPSGYNMTSGGDGAPGMKHSEDTRKRIGKAAIGRVVTQAVRDRLRAAHIGKKLSDAHRAKLSEAKNGKKMPPRTAVHRERISIGLTKAHARRRSMS